MKKILSFVFIIALFFLISCSQKIECNKPYILVGAECCLDQNDNSICDEDETVEESTEVEEETNKVVGLMELFRMAQSENITVKPIRENPTTPIVDPADYTLYENQGYIVASFEGSSLYSNNLYKALEYSIYIVVNPEKLIKTDDDLKNFIRKERSAVKDYFFFVSKSNPHRITDSLRKFVYEDEQSEIDEGGDIIIENRHKQYYTWSNVLQDPFFTITTNIRCGENAVISLNPKGSLTFAGLLFSDSSKEGLSITNTEKSFEAYIKDNRNNLLKSTKKFQEICKDVSYVLVDSCTFENMEKCKFLYAPACKNNDRVCSDSCDYMRDNDCGYGDIEIKDVQFDPVPNSTNANKKVYFKEITVNNPSTYPIDLFDMTIDFVAFNSKRENERDLKDEYDNKLNKSFLINLKYPKSIIPPKSSLRISCSDLIHYQIKNIGHRYIPKQERDLYEKCYIEHYVGDVVGNPTILTTMNRWRNKREKTVDNNEHRYAYST